MRDEGTIGAFLTGFTQVHVRKDKESKPLMSSVIYKSMYLGFWRDVSMSIRLIPTNSIRVILAYWLKCTCWCQSRAGASRESRARGTQNASHHRVRLGVCAAAGTAIGLGAPRVLRHARP